MKSAVSFTVLVIVVLALFRPNDQELSTEAVERVTSKSDREDEPRMHGHTVVAEVQVQSVNGLIAERTTLPPIRDSDTKTVTVETDTQRSDAAPGDAADVGAATLHDLKFYLKDPSSGDGDRKALVLNTYDRLFKDRKPDFESLQELVYMTEDALADRPQTRDFILSQVYERQDFGDPVRDELLNFLLSTYPSIKSHIVD